MFDATEYTIANGTKSNKSKNNSDDVQDLWCCLIFLFANAASAAVKTCVSVLYLIRQLDLPLFFHVIVLFFVLVLIFPLYLSSFVLVHFSLSLHLLCAFLLHFTCKCCVYGTKIELLLTELLCACVCNVLVHVHLHIYCFVTVVFSFSLSLVFHFFLSQCLKRRRFWVQHDSEKRAKKAST